MNAQPGLLRTIDQTGVPLLLARLLLGGLFIYMGWNKAVEPLDFLKLVRAYHMIPEQPPLLLNLIAAALPWIEVWCGLLLIAGVALRGAALSILLMLIGFTIIVAARAFGIHHTEGIPFCAVKFDCGCGAGEEWICEKIPKNLGMCLLSMIVLASRSRKFCLRGDLLRSGAGEPAPSAR